MKANDFSKAPRIAQSNAMFVGATSYKGIFSIYHLTKTWFKMVRMMKKMPGYCRHFIWYDFPFTLGTIAFFEDKDSMLKFARSKYHRELMIWVTDGTRNANGGFIKLFNAEESGYTNGKWRAEENVMQHIERFSPVGTEQQGPFVNPERHPVHHRQ